MRTIQKYMSVLTTDQKKLILSGNVISSPKIEDATSPAIKLALRRELIDKKINNWNTEYLYKLHCSLRFQGNFIVNTLDQMQTYIRCLQNQKKVTSQFPGSILHNDIQLNNGIRPKLPGSEAKFILFTNIRLDFSTNGNDVKKGSEIQNRNIISSYIDSINFATEINPLTGNRGACREGSFLEFGKKRKKEKGIKDKIVSDYKYLKNAL